MKKNSWFLSFCMFMFTILLLGCQEEVQPETAQDNAPLTERSGAHGRAGAVTPEFTFTALRGGQVPFRFFPYGPFTQLSIDWGDGTQEVINGEPMEGISHSYAATGEYAVRIVGDLGNIGVLSFYEDGPTREINLEHLPSLQNFSMHNVSTPRILDFRQNPFIAFIDVSRTDVQNMLFSANAPLTLVNILDNSRYSEKGFQDLIHQAYRSATNNRIDYGGLYIGLQATYELIAPLTPRSKAELRVLRDIFQWDIYPNNF
ncbi:hypothetical protein KK062_26385 [Fulvivirgaceae bacterium PWU5]|uniref:PKD domain-containing protein n=1 Tax=Dawidia cretensis TaxID=2782350 RepID=A0AAP2E4S4_9BACT|nr:hypothetical protein [Dawidia cretensis]MBT1711797.1 hypothetical protein [Dawidia cretensis]